MNSNTFKYSAFMFISLLANSPPCSPLCPLPISLCNEPPLFTYLEIPFLMIVVRMPIHTRPWLVIDCPPLTPYPHPPLQRLPQFMLHVFRDEITTSVTMSDTCTCTRKCLKWQCHEILCLHFSSNNFSWSQKTWLEGCMKLLKYVWSYLYL